MVIALCGRCGGRLLETRIVLDASGPGFRMTISGVPVYSCVQCLTPLRLDEHVGPGVQDIAAAAMSGLEQVAPIGRGEPKNLSFHCRECNTKLADTADETRAHFLVNAPLKPGGQVIGIEYYGDAVTCPRCAIRHPWLGAVLYHQVLDSVTLAASHYLPR